MTAATAAINAQTTHGTVIYIPPAATCGATGNGPSGNYEFNTNPPDVLNDHEFLGLE